MSHAQQTDPVLVLAADDKFAMPLAVTVRSAIDNLAADRRLRIFVLDGGILPATRERVVASWPAGRFDVEWVTVDARSLAGLPISGHIQVQAYFRILISRLLPTDVDRALYLDSDLIVRGDLGRLWDEDFAGCLGVAAQDCGAPFIDCQLALPNFRRCEPFLHPHPVPNYRQLGLRPDAKYFNDGVLLIDVAGWRRIDLPAQLLACLAENREHVAWWDQYALNVVLAGRWRETDRRWNVGIHAFAFPSWEQSPFDAESLRELREDPWIIHFNSAAKPWRAKCEHPWRGEFFRYLDRTAWAGQRPPALERVLALVNRQERRLRRGRKWLGRRVSELLGRANRAAM